ncbi:MAG: hypothetical protein LE168_03510, partial [Endomicrobium sp.]|nr:hypothetical protein [Endomicrobium sp.]
EKSPTSPPVAVAKKKKKKKKKPLPIPTPTPPFSPDSLAYTSIVVYARESGENGGVGVGIKIRL